MLEIYLDHKFHWPQEVLNCWLGNYFICKRFTVQTLLCWLEFVIQINLEHNTIAVWNLVQSWSISIKKKWFGSGHPGCVHCQLDLNIHLSNDCGCRLFFYLLIWMVWHRSGSSWYCCILSVVIGSAISYGFHWSGVVYRWLLWLGPSPKTFQQCHPHYSLEMVQGKLEFRW